jgi:hypothetical protein
MLRIVPALPSRVAACAAAALLLSACQNVPKYKRSNGKFDEWGSYEGKNFQPSNGTVVAIDPTANTITIKKGEVSKDYPVTAETRLMHEGTDITLAEFPINTQVKFSLSEDGSHLDTVWYGHHLYTAPVLLHKQKQKTQTL